MNRYVALTCISLLFGACSGDPTDGDDTGSVDVTSDADGTTDGTDSDAEDAGDDGGDDLDGDSDGGDTSLDDVGERKALGEPCVENGECDGNLCLYIEAGLDEGFCSTYCFEAEDCSLEEWDCIFLQNSGGDAAFVCAPEDLCLDQDGDDFGVGPGCNGPDCDETNATVYIGADELCDGLDNDCDGAIDDNSIEAGQPCTTGFPGVCSEGQSTCDGGLLSCNGMRPPSVEICDSVDNDCDGRADENDDGGLLAFTCYQGAPETLGVGQCQAGAQVCRSGVVSGCEDQVLPFPELCDGLDNDCDGDADEGAPESGVYCETELPGACRRGRTSCADDSVSCIPFEEPGDELCDGVDNDCDGEVDEDTDGEPLTDDCYSGDPATFGVGTCSGGQRTCRAGEWSRCEGEVIPTIELCSSSDEDCDGSVNEGSPASGFLCETGQLGLCAFGRTACGADEGTECLPDYDPAPETCDAFDNDCDGIVDEDESGDALERGCYDGRPETLDVGVCRSGAQTCAFGGWSGCADQVLPSIERCDGIDNDCDGEIDEGNPEGGVACTTGQPGICAAGQSVCMDGALVCEATNIPAAEVCDGLDNDCNGEIDNGAMWSQLARGCFTGQGACRSAGVFVCDAGDPSGPPVCGAEVIEGTMEICDGIDNDCNGVVDDGALWSDRGTICFDGEGACRTAGLQSCNPSDPMGPLVCDAVVPEGTAEVCDGVDNDCDGDTDEDPQWAGAGTVCTVGEGVCRNAGVLSCNAGNPAGPLTCSAAPGAGSEELCDGLDNDCDGDTDEAFPSVGTSCTAGAGVCRAAGVVVCDSPTSASCDAEVPDPPSTNETSCDYIDDDCDGSIDEDFRTGALYASEEHCGGCGVNCAGLWDGGPAAYNVVPVCSVFTMVASCDYDCVDGYFDLDADPSNGCEFTPDSGAIYVSTMENGGVDNGTCGTFDAPCATIGFAIASRAAPGGFDRVRVSDGLFSENIDMVDGVSLLGGHNSVNWLRSPSVNVTAIAGQNTALDNAAVRAESITSTTELSGFTITAAPGRNGGGNSIGVYVRDANQNLQVANNRIFSANGGVGASGANGTGGSNGVNGNAGSPRVYWSDAGDCTGANAGGGPGARTCSNPWGGSTNVNGGTGGGAGCPVYDAPSQNGNTGSGAAPGAGGAGGEAYLGSGSTCFAPDGASEGGTGLAGQPGVDGSGGAGGPTTASIVGGQWRGADGAAASHGDHGAGGGGGGAGGGVDAEDYNDTLYQGASGGGGGSGGCAGAAGTGGSAGGGSFPIFITWTTPPASDAVVPVITGNTLYRGSGGTGGRGGGGGAGGDPGAGAEGGPTRSGGGTDRTYDFCIFSGGDGGTGGRGGHGGGAGGGAGGASFDIFVAGTGGVTPSYASQNNFALPNSDVTSGEGGPGGTSSAPVNAGSTGADGTFGNIALQP